MKLDAPPSGAAWSHLGARSGYEVAFFHEIDERHRVVGQTTASEAGTPWSVGYDITLDDAWATRGVNATLLSGVGSRELTMTRRGGDPWIVNGQPRSDLDGCVDVDFESSAVTNTLPIHRLSFEVGAGIDVPAVFVRAADLAVERLEQRYTLLASTPDGLVFRYESSTFDVVCELELDASGLVLTYPGIAARADIRPS